MPVIRPDPRHPPAVAGPARGIRGARHATPEYPTPGPPTLGPRGGRAPLAETPTGGGAAGPGAPIRRSPTPPERAACPNR